MLKKKRKYCPKCGQKVKVKDQYCTSCGYDFAKRKKKLNLLNIVIAVIILLILWTAVRMLAGKQVIPELLIDIIKNITTAG